MRAQPPDQVELCAERTSRSSLKYRLAEERAPRTQMKGRRRMLKRVIRLLLPLIALLIFAAYLVISPIVASHAAAPAAPATPGISAPHGPSPNLLWRP